MCQVLGIQSTACSTALENIGEELGNEVLNPVQGWITSVVCPTMLMTSLHFQSGGYWCCFPREKSRRWGNHWRWGHKGETLKQWPNFVCHSCLLFVIGPHSSGTGERSCALPFPGASWRWRKQISPLTDWLCWVLLWVGWRSRDRRFSWWCVYHWGSDGSFKIFSLAFVSL